MGSAHRAAWDLMLIPAAEPLALLSCGRLTSGATLAPWRGPPGALRGACLLLAQGKQLDPGTHPSPCAVSWRGSPLSLLRPGSSVLDGADPFAASPCSLPVLRFPSWGGGGSPCPLGTLHFTNGEAQREEAMCPSD